MNPNETPNPQNPQIPETPQVPQNPVAQPQPAAYNPLPQQQVSPTAAPDAAQPPAYPSPEVQTAAAEKRKKPIVLPIAGAVVLLSLLGGIVWALTHKEDKPEQQDNSAATSLADEPEKTKEPAAAASAQTIPLDKTIVDDEMGYTIHATTMGIGNLKIPERYMASNSDKTVVTVHFKNTDAGKFAGTAKNLSLSLVSGEDSFTQTTLSNDDLKAAGLTPLSEAVEANDNVEGEVVFWVDTAKLDSLTLLYKRAQAKVIGSSQTIPAKEFEVVLR